MNRSSLVPRAVLPLAMAAGAIVGSCGRRTAPTSPLDTPKHTCLDSIADSLVVQGVTYVVWRVFPRPCR